MFVSTSKLSASVEVCAVAMTLLVALPGGTQAATHQQALDASATGFAWLASTQNVDGSWGQTLDEKMLYTSEVVRAFWAHNRKGINYRRGVAWLENHPVANIDHATRRFRALARNDAQVGGERAAILDAKVSASPPLIDLSGWGVQAQDLADPLDTALVLIALGEEDPQAFFAQHADAVDGLLASVFGGGVWTIGQGPSSLGDFLTTVTVCEALRLCRHPVVPSCGTGQPANLVDIVLAFAESRMAASFVSADPMGIALIARYFGRFDDDLHTGTSVDVVSMFDRLLADQNAAGNGSWSNDPLVTATALQAVAGWVELDFSGQQGIVAIADPALRRAVNRSLGKAAMDAVSAAEVRHRLEVLDASYAPIADFSVLGGAAENLREIDISGNPCLVNDPNANQILMQLFPNLQTITKRPVGDVNRDNFANSLDDWLLAKELLGLGVLDEDSRRAADLNFDDRLDSRDLFWLGRVLLDEDISALCP